MSRCGSKVCTTSIAIVSSILFVRAFAAEPPAPGTLELSIIDAVSKKPTPARVELVDEKGKGYVAEDALPVNGDCEDRVVPFDLTLERAIAVMDKNVLSPYTQTPQFYSVGNSHVPSLPPGDYKLILHKGPEYFVQKKDVRIESDKTSQVTIVMTRWANMPEKGWYSADDHLHIARPVKELNPFLSKWMQAEDVHVGNLLQWGLSRDFHNTLQYAHGQAGWYREGDYLLASGQENPRTHFRGHTIILGAGKPINFPEAYLIYQLFWQEAARQGALSGYAHFGSWFNGEYGLSVDLPLGLLNFIEVLQFDVAHYDVWYKILNTGFRMVPTAGTDYPCGGVNLPGRERFYTKVEGPFTYEAWLDGIRQGRTFVTNGPMLDLHVNGKDIGSEVFLKSPGPVLVEGSVKFDPNRDQVAALEMIVNGEIVHRFPRKGEAAEISFKLPYEVGESSWIALRASGAKLDEPPRPASGDPETFFRPTALAHTAATYLTIEGAPPISAHPKAKALARYWLAMLDNLEAKLTGDEIKFLATAPCANGVICGDGVSVEYLKKNRSQLLETIGSARKYFTDISGK